MDDHSSSQKRPRTDGPPWDHRKKDHSNPNRDAMKTTDQTSHSGRILFVSVLLCAACFVLSLLAGPAGLLDLRNPTMQTILLHMRLPRALGSLLAGSALAVSGALIQTVLNNPLASANLIGINSAAGFFTILAGILFPTMVGLPSIAGFFGAMLCAGMILLLIWKKQASKLTIILAGLAISQVFSAGIDLLTVIVPDALSGYASFKIGSLASISLSKVGYGAILILPALALAIFCSRQLEMFSLGALQSKALGFPIRRWTVIFLALAALLSAGTVSFCGMLGFVGLIVPAWLRRFHLPVKTYLLECLLCGAMLVCLADVLGRVILIPWELPAGLLLALAGDPYFLYLLLGRRNLDA